MSIELRRFRHKKRGTEYLLLGFGKMQAENWADAKAIADALLGLGNVTLGDPLYTVDMREVAIYMAAKNSEELWVRPREEFEDGRFEEIVPPSPATHDWIEDAGPVPKAEVMRNG